MSPAMGLLVESKFIQCSIFFDGIEKVRRLLWICLQRPYEFPPAEPGIGPYDSADVRSPDSHVYPPAFGHPGDAQGCDIITGIYLSARGYGTATTAHKLIGELAALRAANDAVGYATSQRWINNDVYIHERQFFNHMVPVSINAAERVRSAILFERRDSASTSICP